VDKWLKKVIKKICCEISGAPRSVLFVKGVKGLKESRVQRERTKHPDDIRAPKRHSGITNGFRDYDDSSSELKGTRRGKLPIHLEA